MTPKQASAALAKARRLQASARSNLGRAHRMQPDCKTANDLRDRAHRQEDEAAQLLDLLADHLALAAATPEGPAA